MAANVATVDGRPGRAVEIREHPSLLRRLDAKMTSRCQPVDEHHVAVFGAPDHDRLLAQLEVSFFPCGWTMDHQARPGFVHVRDASSPAFPSRR